MSYYVKPWSDIFFRYLLGSESNNDLLLSFINAVFENAEFDLVKEVEIKNPFNLKDSPFDKESILDIKAVDSLGRTLEIEVQSSGSAVFKARSLYYWARLYSGQIDEGTHYSQLRPVICINLLNFNLIENLDHCHSCFMITEKSNPELALNDHLVLHFLELPKFSPKGVTSKNLETWLTWIKFRGKEDEIVKYAIQDNPTLKKAEQEYRKFTRDDRMRELYEAREKANKDYATGVHEGMIKGKAEGIREGEARGKIETARRMLAKGFTLEDIIELTGLSRDSIEALRLGE